MLTKTELQAKLKISLLAVQQNTVCKVVHGIIPGFL
jgi:hypothetical protein